MMNYTADELLRLRRFDQPPTRQTRKAIFSQSLWTPLPERQEIARQHAEALGARLSAISTSAAGKNDAGNYNESVPSLYVLNAAALAKPHAIEHLAADLCGYDADVAVITETHFKKKHSDSVVGIGGYVVFRRDRMRRRGGGVALYVRAGLQSAPWTYSADDRSYELHWVRVGGNTFVAALYHPPKSIYKPAALLDYIEACVGELNRDFPAAHVVLAGDLNQLSDQELVERTGLTQIVQQPTRGTNILDRIYVSNPQLYSTVRVVASVVKSDHKAVVASAANNQCKQPKATTLRTFRPKTPAQHALFLQHATTLSFDNPQPAASSDPSINAQSDFDHFYATAIGLLNKFYPKRTITVTTKDPDHITPAIKAMLRRKNRLMHAGRVEEAGALAARVGQEMTRRSKTLLSKVNARTDAKDMWAAVKQLTGRQQEAAAVDGVTAESLNSHYAAISTDSSYTKPTVKHSTEPSKPTYISEWRVFRILDHLQPTATGLDGLPAWFLRQGAAIFCKPIANLFNLSLFTSTVPKQWKQASILPIPKVSAPTQHSDFRPISITPVLTRIMERTVVSQFLYSAFLSPPPSLSFSDQFAFRPTGSPTAAIISLLDVITNLLLTNSYVILIALDFSKAFDTVRHSTLLEKLAQLDIPDNVFNWLADFFSGHSHSTMYRGKVSTLKSITASIIQGSGIGPAAYVANAGDLKAVTPGNSMRKFADDTYLVIPASNVDSRDAEINNVELWARTNNLALNRSKTIEVVFTDNRRRRQVEQPPLLPGIIRTTSIKILGVTVTDGLSASDHVRGVISSCAQTLYALRVLRAHGMCDKALQTIYRSVIIAKLQYAASAWWGFTNTTDRQRVDAFLRRSVRCGFCPPDVASFEEQCTAADQQLFDKISNPQHLLHYLLPPPSVASQNYNLRPRVHNRQLPDHSGHLTDSNFITRVLFSDAY